MSFGLLGIQVTGNQLIYNYLLIRNIATYIFFDIFYIVIQYHTNKTIWIFKNILLKKSTKYDLY